MPNRYLPGPASPSVLPHEDDRFAYGEERFITLGLLGGGLVVIAHAPRDEATRIISMRKGNRREKTIYEERLGTD